MPDKLNCFLIDNDEDDQEIFSMALQQVDASIIRTVANNGVQAIEMLKAHPAYIPSFIFIDMNMPLMNGKQCLVELKKIERLAGVPAYMYSTAADPLSIEEVKKLGAVDFIIKPSGFNSLIQLLSGITQLPKSLS